MLWSAFVPGSEAREMAEAAQLLVVSCEQEFGASEPMHCWSPALRDPEPHGQDLLGACHRWDWVTLLLMVLMLVLMVWQLAVVPVLLALALKQVQLAWPVEVGLQGQPVPVRGHTRGVQHP